MTPNSSNGLFCRFHGRDIVITSVGGDITIEATLYATPGDEPLGEELLQAAQDIGANLTSVTNALLDALGAGESQLLSTSTNLCPPARDCSGNGTCDAETGACNCVGNWWGINCETPCICENGGECVGALCVCTYPYYDMRCNSTVSCDQC
jgi:hypothetical protein